MRKRWWLGSSLAAAAVVLAACGTNTSPPSSPATPVVYQGSAGAGSVVIKTMSTSKGTVLANSDGRILYWFAKDTATHSHCNGSCATVWPPVIGTPAAAVGTSLPHGLGTIRRASGQLQATYDGHPLYTYAGDTAAGQINGNGINASGGLWWAVTPSGTDLKSGSGSGGSGGSGGGSGGGGGGW